MNLLIIANAFFTISGGDVIFAEYSNRWLKKGHNVKIVTNNKGKKFCEEYGLNTKDTVISNYSSILDFLGVYIGNLFRVIYSIKQGIFLNIKKYDHVFSASEFLPDILPALIIKIKNKDIKWIAAFYVFAPNPFSKNYKGNKIRGTIYLLSQQISLYIIKCFADIVFTASKEDILYFNSINKKAYAIRGGIDNSFINNIPEQPKVYDSVFVGRLHPQKGAIDLIYIWKNVCEIYKDKKLAIIGEGSEEHKIKHLVKQLNLEDNVIFLGTQTGEEKIKILKSSNVFISASKFDSGNIALDEALACGIPGIVYKVPHLNYPKGVLKVDINQDTEKSFTNALINLLNDINKRDTLGKEAMDFAKELDWNITSEDALSYILSK